MPGQIVGHLLESVQQETGLRAIPVALVGSHDTASAVAGIPYTGEHHAFISSGTWSLMGMELEEPMINEASLSVNFTNEGGFNRTTRLLKNIMGLWITNEARRQWIREGVECSFGQLAQEALEAAPLKCFVDPDDPSFELPGNEPRRIQDFCRTTGQAVPEGRGEIMRCIYESLALKYRYTHRALEEITGLKYDAIHMIGGGTQATLLCQMAADACGVPVIAGPVEATAMGNVAVQLMALGEIASLEEARKVVGASEALVTYLPANTADYDAVYDRFVSILNR